MRQVVRNPLPDLLEHNLCSKVSTANRLKVFYAYIIVSETPSEPWT